MRRPWQIWLAFAGCVLVAVAAVAWLSFRALESERAELTASARAGLEENARLALWRIDSAVAALIAQENARPYFAYRSLYSTSEPHGKAAGRKASNAALAPSPLLAAENPQIKLHFEFDGAGQLYSPRVPTPDVYGRVVPQYLSQQQVDRSSELLQELGKVVDQPQMLALLPPTDVPLVNGQTDWAPQAVAQQPALSNGLPQQGGFNGNANVEQQALVQQARGAYEYRPDRRRSPTIRTSSRPAILCCSPATCERP